MLGMIGGFLASKVFGPIGDIAVGVGQGVVGLCQQYFGKEARAHRKERKKLHKEAKKLKDERERKAKMSPTANAMANRFKNEGKSKKPANKPIVFGESRNFQD